jgi:hypothetical protein
MNRRHFLNFVQAPLLVSAALARGPGESPGKAEFNVLDFGAAADCAYRKFRTA